ncbi:MAG: hypothetical protein AAGA64_16575 [Bacteroidota bacterium]
MLLLPILGGCVKDSLLEREILIENRQLLEIEYYEDKQVKEKSFLSDDSIKNGLSKSYYKNGSLHKESFYTNGKLDSVQREFYESGKIKSARLWDFGQPTGEFITYYDGLLDVYFTEMDGDTMRVEEPLKKSYAVYNHLHKISYEWQYDKKGELISEEGEGILFIKTTSVELSLSDTLSIQYYLASPD